MNNIIKVNFEEWRDVKRVDVNLSEWNYGHVLQVEGLTLPDGDIEVDFSLTEHEGESSAFFGKVEDNILTVNIPDFIFQKEDIYSQPAYDAYAFIYQSDGESGRTIKKIVFTIQARPKRTTNVPEDQKDQFLNEVRQIMAETKGIAQSVRNDADNGAFDGEKGDKGDAGVIEYIPCTELPTEDIRNAIYLLKRSDAEDGNLYDEYIYTNGVWELLGSKPIKLDLSNYVTFDDMASQAKAGLVKTYIAGGTAMDANKRLVLLVATEEEIKNRTTAKKVITPSNMDLVVQEALANCQIEWTKEQVKKVWALLGYTDNVFVAEYKVTPFADILSAFQSGKLCCLHGHNNAMWICTHCYDNYAMFTRILHASNKYKDDMSLGTLQGVEVYPDETWKTVSTFVKPTIQTLINESTKDLLQKASSTSSYAQVYVKTKAGEQEMVNYSTSALANHLVQRLSTGQIPVPITPAQNSHATSKQYVDNAIESATEKKRPKISNIVTNSAGTLRLEKNTTYMIYCKDDMKATINTYGDANLESDGTQRTISGKLLSITCGNENGSYVDSDGNEVVDTNATAARFFASAVETTVLGTIGSAEIRRGYVYQTTDDGVYAEVTYPADCTIVIQKY